MITPLVSGLASIIIPCWKQLEFTRRCIASVFRQSGPGWELIVVNNGSTGGPRLARHLKGVVREDWASSGRGDWFRSRIRPTGGT